MRQSDDERRTNQEIPLHGAILSVPSSEPTRHSRGRQYTADQGDARIMLPTGRHILQLKIAAAVPPQCTSWRQGREYRYRFA